MGVAFQGLPEGAPDGDYTSRAIVNRCGAPTTDTAFMWVTSWPRSRIAGKLARWRRGAQSICSGRARIDSRPWRSKFRALKGYGRPSDRAGARSAAGRVRVRDGAHRFAIG